MYFDDYTESQTKTYTISFKQDVLLEENKNQKCVIYPTEKFISYEDYDQQFPSDLLNNETVYPAWAAPEDLAKATNISKGARLNYKTVHFFVGDLHNPCGEPCKRTSFHSFYSFTDYGVVGDWRPSLLLDLNHLVEVTRHVFPRYDMDPFLLDLGSCSGLWLALSVTQVMEMAVMAMVNRIRDRSED